MDLSSRRSTDQRGDSIRAEGAGRTAVQRHPIFAYGLLACAITWLAVLPLVVGARVPGALHALGALGPVAGAVIVQLALSRRGEVRALWRSTTEWRAGPGWLVLTLLSPFALFGLAVLVTRPALGDVAAAAAHPHWLLEAGLISLAYGFGEEPGWRGFALPRRAWRRATREPEVANHKRNPEHRRLAIAAARPHRQAPSPGAP